MVYQFIVNERCPYCKFILPILKSDKLKSASELIKQGIWNYLFF